MPGANHPAHRTVRRSGPADAASGHIQSGAEREGWRARSTSCAVLVSSPNAHMNRGLGGMGTERSSPPASPWPKFCSEGQGWGVVVPAYNTHTVQAPSVSWQMGILYTGQPPSNPFRPHCKSGLVNTRMARPCHSPAKHQSSFTGGP
uniref:Uncharacterized protein n=1 Tax=Eutreptiella gymnastica TaxID=73025 RepID=A0A6T2LUJ1_9EUGL